MRAEHVDLAPPEKFVADGDRIVFWHDPNGESCDYLAGGLSGDLAGVKVLDTETNKALLGEHILRNQEAGSPLRDLEDVLPAESHRHIRHLLSELRKAGVVHRTGETRGSRWYPGPGDGADEGDP